MALKHDLVFPQTNCEYVQQHHALLLKVKFHNTEGVRTLMIGQGYCKVMQELLIFLVTPVSAQTSFHPLTSFCSTLDPS